MDIFPSSIRPEQEPGLTAITNLKAISQYEKDLKKVQQLMLEQCVDEGGRVVKIGFRHTDAIFKAIKASQISNARNACF
jgi:hypothetical protein